MNLVDDVLDQFGRSIGLDDLKLREDGCVLLDMQRLGSLAVELIGQRQEDVGVSLSRRIEVPSAEACLRAIELCHYRSSAPWPVRACLNGRGDLMFAVLFVFSDFTLPNLNQAIDWLDGLHRQMESVVRLA